MKDQIIEPKEELLNTISHAIGVVLGIVGLFLLLFQNSEKTPYATTSIVIYGLSFISMFVISSLYHYVSNIELKKKLRIADHINIYFFIAGSYTPVSLITLINGKGWTIFYLVWGMTFVGILLKLFLTGKFEIFSLLIYLGLGWLIVYDLDTLVNYMSSQGVFLLFLGGAFYTLGVIFYAIDKIPYNHFIWHTFVLAGAICHLFMIYYYVV